METFPRRFGSSNSANDRLRIIVLGYIVRGPLGGLAWHHLQYVLGLAALGHDVWFIEDSDDYPSCYDPVRNVTDTEPSYGLRFALRAFERLGLAERWAFYDAHRLSWHGPGAEKLPGISASADLLLNLSGVNPLRPWFREIPRRALIDTDPVFTQIRHLIDPQAMETAAAHNSFFSFAENIAAGNPNFPHDGLPWQVTRQPVVLDAWPVTPGDANEKFTTVMQWDSYQPREHDGIYYGMKSASFERYLDLPKSVGEIFDLALGGSSTRGEWLRSHGWQVRDPRPPTLDPWTYQDFIRQSKAEFSVSKHGYVVSRSGWFSERTTSYLASGRPAVIEDTGFSDWLPTGAGVFAFSSPEEAITGIEAVNDRYEFHCKQARDLVAAFFDSRRVLADLVARALNGVTITGAARAGAGLPAFVTAH